MGLNDYRVIKQLGGGGFGDTYLVEAMKLPGSPKRVLKHLQPKQQCNPQELAVLQRLFDFDNTPLTINI